MEKTLLDLYNSTKNLFAKAMEPYLRGRAVYNKVTFKTPLRISLPRDNDEFYEDITGIEYDEEEKTWYVHNYITETDLTASEYWTPLGSMTFDELYKIAEKL